MLHANAFIHLHGHSEHSINDGISKIDQMCARAADLGMPAIALTDHGVVSGWAELDKYARKSGIQPLFGVEAYVVDNTLAELGTDIGPRRHMVIIAMNEVGLRNLTILASLSTMRFYRKPIIDLELLAEFNEGLFVTTACLGGWCAQEFYRETGYEGQGTPALAAGQWGRLYDIFADRCALEIQPFADDKQLRFNMWALAEAERDPKVRLVATNDFHYVWAADAKHHPDVVRAALSHGKAGELDRIEKYINYAGGAHIRTRKEMVDAFTALHGTEILKNRHFWDAMALPEEVWIRSKHITLMGKMKIPLFKPPCRM